ncbi:low molecular weight protein-tyrosine-phosphatase [Millisia brevis]|uniref:low molecular weight protein-tyrosine-phosphatase n=1 Tax=Millisia brevis TaxID=264148 RepID=UPI000B2CAB4D|nr:low molecular weight protein-tyrosine-phosphatase [Millisia brevis]
MTPPEPGVVTPPERVPVHVTFVCTGNICRSPMADRIVATAVERAGLADEVQVTSAGTGSWHVGDRADARARAELERHGYPSAHTARHVDDDILSADLIIALDRGHAKALRALGADPSRVRLLREFDPQAVGDLSVADPYYGSARDFAEVREQIEAAVPGLLEEIRTLVGTDR